MSMVQVDGEFGDRRSLVGGGGPNWGIEAPGSDHNLWVAGNHGQEVFGNVRLAAGFVFLFLYADWH